MWSTLSLYGCSHISVHDYIFWGDKGNKGATGVHSLCPLDKCPAVLLDKDAWAIKRIGMVCEDFTVISEIQANVDKMCAKHPGDCIYDQIAATRRNVHFMLVSQQMAGVKVPKEVMQQFDPARDQELIQAAWASHE